MYISLKGLFAALSSLLIITAPQSVSEVKVEYTVTETRHSKQDFIDFLIQCESGGNDKAINPRDRDGSPSWGLLQFKPDTLYKYVKRYSILPSIESQEIMNVIFDGELQVRVLKEMLEDPAVDWYREFPDCYRRWIASGRK